MPKIFKNLSGNNTTFDDNSGHFIDLSIPITNYIITNKGSVDVIMSHDKVNTSDIIEPGQSRVYNNDYQQKFYFRCATGIWWLYFCGW